MSTSRLLKCLSVFIGLAMIPAAALAQRWTFSLGGAYGGGYKIGSAPYSKTLPGTYVSLSDSGSISATAKNGAGGAFSVMYSFSKNWGLRLQIAYMSPAPVNLTSAYALSWTFAAADDTGTYRITRQMANTGDLQAVSFHLELVWTVALGKSTFVHLGAALLRTGGRVRHNDMDIGILL